MPQMMPILWELVMLIVTLVFLSSLCFWSQFFIFKSKGYGLSNYSLYGIKGWLN